MSLQALTISVVMTDEYILRWLLIALNNTVGNDILFVPACDRKRLTTLYIHLVSYRTADELCSGASMSMFAATDENISLVLCFRSRDILFHRQPAPNELATSNF